MSKIFQISTLTISIISVVCTIFTVAVLYFGNNETYNKNDFEKSVQTNLEVKKILSEFNSNDLSNAEMMIGTFRVAVETAEVTLMECSKYSPTKKCTIDGGVEPLFHLFINSNNLLAGVIRKEPFTKIQTCISSGACIESTAKTLMCSHETMESAYVVVNSAKMLKEGYQKFLKLPDAEHLKLIENSGNNFYKLPQKHCAKNWKEYPKTEYQPQLMWMK